MANALFSGCDSFGLGFSAAELLSTSYNSTSGHGSSGPPSGTNMSFIGVYPSSITASQFNSFFTNGVAVFFFYENSGAGSIQPSFNSNYLAATTYEQGVIDATGALNDIAALGLVTPTPVYFAVDYDAGAASFPNLANYFAGVQDTMGVGNVGLYGSGFVITSVNEGLNGSGRPVCDFYCQSRSSGWSGNGDYITTSGTTQNLWQWPPAYSPGGNVTIGGKAVDGEFAYTANFGQYTGSTPPPPLGSLTLATISTNVTYTQPEPQTLIVPEYQSDRVLYSTIFSTSVSASTWPQNIAGPKTNLSQYAYPIGNFSASVNGGATQTNDFGFIFNGDFASYIGDLPNVVVQPIVTSSGGVSFDVTYNPPTGGSSSATINLTINIALMATPNSTTISAPSVGQNTAYSNVIHGALPTPYATYRRISKDSSVGTGNTTVPHGLNEIPNLLYWVKDNSGTIEMQPSTWTSLGAASRFGISMDSTNIYFFVDTLNNSNALYRTYLDN